MSVSSARLSDSEDSIGGYIERRSTSQNIRFFNLIELTAVVLLLIATPYRDTLENNQQHNWIHHAEKRRYAIANNEIDDGNARMSRW